ncbi:MAG TPA: hypothetical protein VFW88_08460, partial [Burkholderiales bacterium]|nr:hypothetical protein [Burkholderiales bacterium]
MSVHAPPFADPKTSIREVLPAQSSTAVPTRTDAAPQFSGKMSMDSWYIAEQGQMSNANQGFLEPIIAGIQNFFDRMRPDPARETARR